MLSLSDPKTKNAFDATRKAARLMRVIQRETVVSSLTKGDKSPVTIADFASQALIGYMLSTAFPDIPMVAEETSTALRAPDGADLLKQVTGYVQRVFPDATEESVCAWIDHGGADSGKQFWVLDPIDGTKGYLRGDQYAVALALVEDGEVQIGALGCPNLTDASTPDPDGPGCVALAARGQGTWVTSLAGNDNEWRQLNVSNRNNGSQARLMRSFESGHTDVGLIDHIAEHLGVQVEPVRMDSQAKYAVLASGGGEVILRLLSPQRPDYREKIWDQAAGSLILEEAGGRITDLSGKPLDFTQGRLLIKNRGVLASNGHLHEVLLQTLAALNG
jgi:3'(2'), 5'-bisphosphate nucleotidase